MTGHEDDFLVRVRAQVMTRDESTEGWLPMSGGGLAHVSIRKRTKLPPDASGHEYIIFGQRISDQTVILSCAINRDLQYFKVMPTFHHWRAGKQRNGLTFQTAADARAFDKGIIKAYDDLLTDGIEEKASASWDKYDSLVGEDDVFMTLDLPRENSDSRCGSEGSGSQKSDQHHPLNISYISPTVTEAVATAAATTTTGSRSSTPLAISPTSLSRRHSPPSGTLSSSSPSPPLHASHHQHHHPQYIHQTTSVITHPPQHQQPAAATPPPPLATITGKIATISSSTPSALIPPPPGVGGGVGVMDHEGTGQIAPGDNYSYVQLTTTVHHDTDPPLIRATTRRDSTCSLKKRTGSAATDSPLGIAGTGTVMKTRLRCRYCQEFYTEEWNKRGACDYAPDCFRTMIDRIPGMPCARGLVYHCMSDAEGDTVAHPCDCGSAVDGSCTKRWFGLALLSLLMPCLWCYPPLKACHSVGISCGMCGGKHKPYI